MALFLVFLGQIAFSAVIGTDLHQLAAQNHRPISYNQANEILFIELNRQSGVICSVYSPSFCLNYAGVPSHKVMNIEHTWPQSEGAHGDAKSDLHHLFPTTSSSNSMRSNYPFCDVKTIRWEDDQSRRGFDEYNTHCFEPPQNHKGNVARAMFYFSLRYKKEIDANQEATLRRWHVADPVDADEQNRNEKIERFQGNRNLFIDHPEYVETISNF
jgi:deoxyribonuclease I